MLVKSMIRNLRTIETVAMLRRVLDIIAEYVGVDFDKKVSPYELNRV